MKSITANAEVKIDDQTKAYLRMWSAVISLAIRDACYPPIKEKLKEKAEEKDSKKKRRKEHEEYTAASHARSAMYFLFDNESDIGIILDWLNIDVGNFRKNLLDKMFDDSGHGYFFEELTDQQRRNFRLNYQWFLKRINIGAIQ
jgi:uncharacterized protein YwqG